MKVGEGEVDEGEMREDEVGEGTVGDSEQAQPGGEPPGGDDFLTWPLGKILGAPAEAVYAKQLKVHTLGDLLHHYPRRYASRGELISLGDAVEGEPVTVIGRVKSSTSRRMRSRPGVIVEVVIEDGTNDLHLTWFNQGWRVKQLPPGRKALFSGTVGAKYRGQEKYLQLVHPECMVLDEDAGSGVGEQFAENMLAIYPATGALPSWDIAKAIGLVLDVLHDDVPDPLPEDVRTRHGLMGRGEALLRIHRPPDRKTWEKAKDRLRFDEAFVLQVALAQRRAATRTLIATPRSIRPDGLLAAFDARLPFTLTGGQVHVAAEIEADLACPYPMHRLLQGEVGSGKTVVALRAMLAVVDAGGQAALLAPTEVLAQQHHRNLLAMLGPLGAGGELGAADRATRVALLTGSSSAPARRRALLDAQSGDAGIVVGTHALLEDRVGFADLGLVVVDEQHRFGVEQRDALRAKGERPPHLLVMTATPIPRTVAMTVFGDLDVSTLSELPAGRAPITTHVVPAEERPNFLERAWGRIREEVAAGRQAFVVCPRIGDEADEAATKPKAKKAPAKAADPVGAAAGGWGEDLWGGEEWAATPSRAGAKKGATKGGAAGSDLERRPPVAVIDVLPMLDTGPLAGLRIEALHGRLAPEVKEHTMRRFAAGEVDVLVATTVVEVGVDVPNATVMTVMDADRFGVSQLHQLRGRIGRGGAPGLCLLVTDTAEGSPARQRLDAVAATTDGFELSRLDLEHRHEGDVLGETQSGRRSSLRLLEVIKHEDLIATARQVAAEIVAADPDLTEHPAIAAALRVLLDPERAEFLDKA